MSSSTKQFFVSRYVRSSIGKKQIMAITGILLIGFLIMHLLGNLTLIIGPDVFNEYAHRLISLGPLLYVAESILLILFLSHLGLAFKLTLENKKARGSKYVMKKNTGAGTTFASSTMPYTGLVILAFLINHLLTLKWGTYYETTLDGQVVRDLYRTTMETFSSPLYALWYVFTMICLGVHLSHGFQSSFQSLGFSNPNITPIIKKLGCFLSLGIGFGFAALAIFCYAQSIL